MSFRTRVLLATLPLAILPLALFAWRIRDRLDDRLRQQYVELLDAAEGVARAELDAAAARIGTTLAALRDEIDDDNVFRLAVLEGGAAERRHLLDLAPRAMARAGLDVLRVQDAGGRILSSGHFRNEFDRVDPVLARAAAEAGTRPFVAVVATPDGELIALLRAVGLDVRDREITIIGGVALDDEFLAGLARDRHVLVTLDRPDGAAPAARASAATSSGSRPAYALPSVAGDSVRFVVYASAAPIEALRQDIDRWFFGLLAAVALLALLLANWVASRVSRPLAELARRTASIDLNRLNADFETDRADEIGSLSRMLGALQRRLRSGAARLRDAERRAAIGEIARQVNHDVRNGLTPIRNVVSHLSEVARERPDALPAIFLERQRTLDASIEYLHGLAANYARLSPRLERTRCDVNGVAGEVARAVARDGARLVERLAPRLPHVLADPIALRRVVENLVTNAVESLPERGGAVTIETGTTGDPPGVRIIVADNGRGMSREELGRAFDHFYTTKTDGTGLGLSIVRRLVGDMGGRIGIDSEPGRGTRVTIDLPLADGAQRVATPDGSARGEKTAPPERAASTGGSGT